MPRRARGNGKGPSVAALGRVRLVRGGYRDPRTGTRYTAAAVGRAVRALGIDRQALTARGFGSDWPTQRARLLAFQRATGVPGAPATRLARAGKLALGSRDSLKDLLQSYRRASGRTAAEVADPRSGFWRALYDLSHAPRTVTRDGKDYRVKATSKLAGALVRMGLRPAWATWRVGESPAEERVAKFLAREDGAPPPWSALTSEEQARVNAAVQPGGVLAPRAKGDRVTAEDLARRAVGKRSANNPRRREER